MKKSKKERKDLMAQKQLSLLTAAISSILGGETIESLFARQLADENGWYFVGFQNDIFQFHDVFQGKDFSLTKDEVMNAALNRTN